MGCDNGPSASAVVAEAIDFKERSRSNPHGVCYMDHLWELVKNCTVPLRVMLWTDHLLFPKVSVPVYWTHGRLDWMSGQQPEKSTLVFDIPDEVIKQIQSRAATKYMRERFGQTWACNLPEAIVDPKAQSRDWHRSFGPNTQHVVISNDWNQVLKAIQATAEDQDGQLGGQTLRVYTGTGPQPAYARIQDGRLEIYIGHLVELLVEPWVRSLCPLHR